MTPETIGLIRLTLTEASFGADGWLAAVRVDGGPVATGGDHHQAWEEWYDSMGIDHEEALQRVMDRDHPGNWEEGFTDPSGVFLTREESLARWRRERGYHAKGLINNEWADSEDLYREAS